VVTPTLPPAIQSPHLSTATPRFSNAPVILVADDQPDVSEAIHLLFKRDGIKVIAVDSPARAVAALTEREFDAVLIDLNYARDTTSGTEGLDLLTTIQQLDDTLPVIVMTAWGSIELAVEAMRRGARDFVQKPWDNERLAATVRTQVEMGRVIRHSHRLEAENALLRSQGAAQMIAEAEAMQSVMEMIHRVAPSPANVLITGENGSGKGVVARALHEMSDRRDQAMITVNMGGLSESVFESELFGHVKGAFTDAKTDRVGRFELADGGTLFLDEIGNLSGNQQTRLLRVLETGEFEPVGSSRTRRADVRVVSATNADLGQLVEKGGFRQDLLFRLNTIEIKLPPLRERRRDIPLLAGHFLAELQRRHRTEVTGISSAAFEALAAHPWPGNVRELSHVIERAVLMARGNQIQPGDLGLVAAAGGGEALESMTMDEIEKLVLRKALERSGGNAIQAAKALGLSRSAFYRRLEKYGL
jgi:DNA-binding NtrC family response regulator